MKKINTRKLRLLMVERGISPATLARRAKVNYIKLITNLGSKNLTYTCHDSTFDKIKNALNLKFDEVKDEDIT